MKRLTLLTLVCCIALVLQACTSVSTPSTAAPTNRSMGPGISTMQLALGMLTLDSTSTPVDAQQAAALLPLWKAARALGKSDTAAAAEKTGLLKQIQSTLTSEQLQAIQSMTAEDISAVSKQYGFEMGPAGAPPASAGASGTSSDAPAGGMAAGGGPGMDGGGAPPMGGGPGGPPSGSTSLGGAESTPVAGMFQGVSTDVLEVVIKFLQSKVQ